MKIITWNVNGIRAIEKKGNLHELLEREQPDVLFLQEIKAKADQLSPWLVNHPEYEQHYHSAEKPGYSGTGMWIKKTLIRNYTVIKGMPEWHDTEGRIIGLQNSDIAIMGIYFPNGGKSPEAWKEKLVFYDFFQKYVRYLRENGLGVIFSGDLNVAHNPIDLARPKENEKNIGFLPEERVKITRLLEDGWVDVFREKYPDSVSYTWWQMQSRARERNIGWRIDYFMLDRALYDKVNDIKQLTEQMGSDHCPVVLEIQL